jgi:hypothetical protein
LTFICSFLDKKQEILPFDGKKLKTKNLVILGTWRLRIGFGAPQMSLNTIESTLDQVPGDFHFKITKLLLKYDGNEF